MKKMQMVFQTPTESFDPRQTLGDGVAESLINHGMKRKEAIKEAENLLELCGLKKNLQSDIRMKSVEDSVREQPLRGQLRLNLNCLF